MSAVSSEWEDTEGEMEDSAGWYEDLQRDLERTLESTDSCCEDSDSTQRSPKWTAPGGVAWDIEIPRDEDGAREGESGRRDDTDGEGVLRCEDGDGGGDETDDESGGEGCSSGGRGVRESVAGRSSRGSVGGVSSRGSVGEGRSRGSLGAGSSRGSVCGVSSRGSDGVGSSGGSDGVGSSRGSVGAGSSRGSVGAGSSRGGVGAGSSRSSVDGGSSRGGVGAGSSRSSVGGVSSRGSVDGVSSRGSVGAGSSRSTVGVGSSGGGSTWDHELDSVRVAVRVRPLVVEEELRRCRVVVEPVAGDVPQVRVHDALNHTFNFDYVFGPDCDQRRFYNSCVRHLIEKLFDGVNVTILAYGQTSSGKTYSMGTSCFAGTHCGVIPRAVQDIFSTVNADAADAIFRISVTYLELYQEHLFDLLSPARVMLEVREDASGVCVPGLTELPVTSAEETTALLQRGSAWRATGSTAMNAQSSRSHAIFTLKVRRRPLGPLTAASTGIETSTVSQFHLVDLAGSERQTKAQSTGERLREGISINRGLLALGNVIAALGGPCARLRRRRHQQLPHISYRNSKLTRLLQNSLGGNSVTLLIACVSPADYNVCETLNTLRYADRAKNIKNAPVANVGADDCQTETELRRRVLELRAELREAREAREDALTRSIEDTHIALLQRHLLLWQTLNHAYNDNLRLCVFQMVSDMERDRRKEEVDNILVTFETTLKALKEVADVSGVPDDTLLSLEHLQSRLFELKDETHKDVCLLEDTSLITLEMSDADDTEATPEMEIPLGFMAAEDFSEMREMDSDGVEDGLEGEDGMEGEDGLEVEEPRLICPRTVTLECCAPSVAGLLPVVGTPVSPLGTEYMGPRRSETCLSPSRSNYPSDPSATYSRSRSAHPSPRTATLESCTPSLVGLLPVVGTPVSPLGMANRCSRKSVTCLSPSPSIYPSPDPSVTSSPPSSPKSSRPPSPVALLDPSLEPTPPSPTESSTLFPMSRSLTFVMSPLVRSPLRSESPSTPSSQSSQPLPPIVLQESPESQLSSQPSLSPSKTQRPDSRSMIRVNKNQQYGSFSQNPRKPKRRYSSIGICPDFCICPFHLPGSNRCGTWSGSTDSSVRELRAISKDLPLDGMRCLPQAFERLSLKGRGESGAAASSKTPPATSRAPASPRTSPTNSRATPPPQQQEPGGPDNSELCCGSVSPP